MIEEILAEAGEKMEKTIEATKTEFAKVRTGRVNPAIFSGLTAEYYGAPTPLQQLVSFNVEDARTVKIVPFDVTALAAIETPTWALTPATTAPQSAWSCPK